MTPSWNYDSIPATVSSDMDSLPKPTKHIKVWNPEVNSVIEWPVSQFEQFFKVKFCPFIVCTNDYIEELLFSGLSIDPDIEFRRKFVPQIYLSSGDENVILARVNENVGYGVFAAKDFKEGEYIIRYGGCLTKSRTPCNSRCTN